MAYHEYNWQCSDLSMRWRVAELYARFAIGVIWSVSLYTLLAYIYPPDGIWAAFTGGALLLWGIHMATPGLRPDPSNASRGDSDRVPDGGEIDGR